MMTTEQEEQTPRVWIGSLSAYNNGRLIGEWCDADDLSTLEEAAARVLARGGGEEFALFDFEGFGEMIGEYTSLPRVAELAEALADHGDAFRLYCEHDKSWAESEEVSELVENFEDAYCGQWDSIKAYGEDDWPECREVPESIMAYIDWDLVEREYEHEGFWEQGGHVFRPV